MLYLGVALVAIDLLVATAYLAWHAGDGALRHRRTRRRERVRRTVAMALAADDLSVLDQLRRGDRSALVDVALQLEANLRGDDRRTLAAVLRDRGELRRAQRAASSRSFARRAQAAEIAGWIGDASTVDLLARLLRDRDEEVRILAARGLGRLGEPAAAYHLLHALATHRISYSVAAASLVKLDPTPTDEIVASLTTMGAGARRTAALVIGQLRLTSHTDDLVARLRTDEEPTVRQAAAIALGELEHPSTLEPLVDHLASERDAAVVAAVATAIGRLGLPSSVPPLLALLDAEPLAVRRAAASAIALVGPAGVELLEEAVDQGGRPRAAAAWALIDADPVRASRVGATP